MKRLLSVMLLAILAIGLVGCASNRGDPNGPPVMTEQQVNQSIIKHERDIRLGTHIATRTVLRMVEPQDRLRFAIRANEFATSLNKAVQNGPVDLSEVRELAQLQIANTKVEYQLIAAELADVTCQVIESYLTSVYANAPEDGRVRAVQAMLRGATQGVIDATAPLISNPTTQPTALDVRIRIYLLFYPEFRAPHPGKYMRTV